MAKDKQKCPDVGKNGQNKKRDRMRPKTQQKGLIRFCSAVVWWKSVVDLSRDVVLAKG